MAQSVKHQTLDLGSGHDLTVCEMDPTLASEPTAWSLLGVLSVPLSLPLPRLCSLSLSLKINKL